MWWIAPVIIVVIILFWIIGIYNSLKRMSIKIDEAESGIDIALTKRFDVLTKMIETVKGYAKHEKETLENVIKMRNQVHGSTTMSEKQQLNTQMNEAMRAINVVVEQYPDLKASENFQHLQASITDVEEHLQASRRSYNSNVSLYNQKVQIVPSNIVASMFNFTTRDFFEAEERKREDVDINF